MRVLVSGSSGLIGCALTSQSKVEGHSVIRLVRKKDAPDSVYWDPSNGVIAREELEGVEAVVHLAGENIADRRWTEAQKALIRNSCVQGTQLLSEAIAQLNRRPE